MKVGIMTFHWARNCGAVIQCFALQNFLLANGFDVRVIDYAPQVWWRRWKNFLLGNAAHRRRCKMFAAFRRKHLKQTCPVLSRKSLARAAGKFDALVSGSDQVWNLNYAKKADGSRDWCYFFDFASDSSTEKIAYAASAGNGLHSPEWGEVAPFIKNFAAVSVREPGLAAELAKFGIASEVVADPALLLEKADYAALLPPGIVAQEGIFGYLLKETKVASACLSAWAGSGKNCRFMACVDDDSNWGNSCRVEVDPAGFLRGIYSAEKVLTDSFHGTVFSLIFNRPFATLVKSTDNDGGNERLINLLESCGLSDRLIKGDEATVEQIAQVLDTPVDWARVNAVLAQMRQKSGSWLLEKLK